MLLDNIAIVGGGTAGLIVALVMRKTYPHLKIDLIESDKIGIVGVGEGTTEHWNAFLQDCNISLSDLIKETDATFKYGINFDNWNGDGERYIHTVSSAFNLESQTQSKFLYSYLISAGTKPDGIIHPYVPLSLHKAPYWGVNQFHFNTFKLNEFLHKLCEQRDIGIIKAEIDKVNLDTDGNIDNLVSTDGRIFDYEFYVDSTGFHKLLVHKAMGSKWISYKEYLPMNSAIAFPTPRTDEIPSWTLSKAMNSGWLWRIPTQDRYGNGYVFDDRFQTFEGAKKEVEELYGYEINVAKEIKFEAGFLEKCWIKNCAAIGLSCGFVEPLEASSIGCSIQQAFLLSTAIASYVPGIDYAERTFNQECKELLENIFDFVALHYVCKRDDTPFWKSVKNLPRTASLQEKLDIFKYKFPGKSDFENRRVMFKEANWILVMHGLGLIPKEVAAREFDIQPPHVKDSIKYNLSNMIGETEIRDRTGYATHREALQWLVDNPDQV